MQAKKKSVWTVRGVKNCTQSGPRFNEFDDFLGTSLQCLEEQATNFLLVVEAELK